MEAVWTEPGSGFSDDWLGFHRSTEKKASGRFYAQCKYCAVVMDGRLPNLRKHKLICAELASAHDVDNVVSREEISRKLQPFIVVLPGVLRDPGT